MENERLIKPIGYIQTDFKEKFGIPRQSGRVPSTIGRIMLVPKYRNVDSIRSLEGFSHLWLIFGFSENPSKMCNITVRPPRLGGNKKVGVFASRSPFRPNGIGLSSVRLLRIDHTDDEGPILIVGGVDLLNGTPVYDIKPYLKYTDCHNDAVCGYADKECNYKLKVDISNELLNIIPEDVLKIIADCIADDPRPSYQDEPERIYGMRYGEYDVRFTVSDGVAKVFSAVVIQT